MGTTKTLLLLTQVIVWGFIAAALLLDSSLTIAVAGGTVPRPSVSGLGTVPMGSLGVATGIFALTMAVTSRVAP